MRTRECRSRAVIVSSRSAVLAHLACVLYRFEARPHPDLKLLDVAANLDDDSRAFMARALQAQLGHFWNVIVIQHEVDIAIAKPSLVDLNEDIVFT